MATSSNSPLLGYGSSTLPTDSTPGSSSSSRLIPSASPSSSMPPSTASPPQTERRKLDGWKHSAAGSLGGMAGAIVTSPFDVVKTRLQSDLFRHNVKLLPSAQLLGEAKPLAARGGLWHFVDTVVMIKRIGTEEGWRALYKGLGPSLVGIIPARAINFYCYPTSKAWLAEKFPNAPTEKAGQTSEESPLIHLGAAVIAGFATATGTNPIWVVKTRLQLSAKKIDKSAPTTSTPSSVLPKPIANSAAALSQAAPVAGATAATTARGSILGPAATMTMDIIKQDGIRGLYKGLSASYIGVSEGVIQWTLYERFKQLAKDVGPQGQEPTGLSYIGSIVGASGGAKTVASLITYPHEVIRTRLRQPAVNGVVKYKGLAQTLKLLLAEEGVASLYGGLTAHMLRVVPNAACMFLIYELVAAKLA